MTDAATHFYEKQYSINPINDSSVGDLLSYVSSKQFLSEATQSSITLPLTFNSIWEAVNCHPHHHSPGPEGMPYEILSLLFREDGQIVLWHAPVVITLGHMSSYCREHVDSLLCLACSLNKNCPQKVLRQTLFHFRPFPPAEYALYGDPVFYVFRNCKKA
ncbi:hypothetical protein PHYBLDRAFT_176304 [Phycomyces blakesleeanus NRRL 1555(-)]|uniref:Uncharacterized protein n=1 Tax=Phycomyces blakesleeanus (strain ATCC 8743b / DSM 1359 / FGSC 10004 / NBRC 33097 / NRRL 1555) TaxID=763407 RepID=A0A162N2T5_PHYB8|nr:hypothetical protein PHYBLDRAFT_176304 [Phycomyces blakesleeanus NRRL 1555(-)]OAD65264.1 hypothetical protein PHYBLDRAFT_176304 [Phycomyces blakesleeanus NRRL 1555(-)]|eukprot:XP_018283304.1 hypothetical protein PHYBLDRAFT_176304 [Phycomyces blakesleeanus NRRL 1555(-)]